MIREANIVINWIKENLPTIFVSVVVAALIILAVVKLARDGKRANPHAAGVVAAVPWLNFVMEKRKRIRTANNAVRILFCSVLILKIRRKGFHAFI